MPISVKGGEFLVASVLLAMPIVVAGDHDARAQERDCHAVHAVGGKRQVVDCPAGSGFDFCLTRNLIDLNGLLTGRLDYFQRSSEGSILEQNPAIQVYVGFDTITTEEGALEFSETGLSDTKSRKFVGIAEVTNATGDLAGYSGTVVSMGDPGGLLTTGTICKLKE